MKTDQQLRDIDNAGQHMKPHDYPFAAGRRALYNAGSADSERAGYLRGLEAAKIECSKFVLAHKHSGSAISQVAVTMCIESIQRIIDAEKPPASQEGGRG